MKYKLYIYVLNHLVPLAPSCKPLRAGISGSLLEPPGDGQLCAYTRSLDPRDILLNEWIKTPKRKWTQKSKIWLWLWKHFGCTTSNIELRRVTAKFCQVDHAIWIDVIILPNNFYHQLCRKEWVIKYLNCSKDEI